MEAPLTGETGANDPAIGYNIWPRWMPGHRASEMHFSISRLAANNPLKGFCHNARAIQCGVRYAKLPRASDRTRCPGFSTSRLCIGWPRGDARGSFRSYSHAKRGASPLRLPACRAGQQ